MLVRNCPVSHSLSLGLFSAILRNSHFQTTFCESLEMKYSRADLLHEKKIPRFLSCHLDLEGDLESTTCSGVSLFPLPSQSRSSLLGSGTRFSSRYEKAQASRRSSSQLAHLLSSSYRPKAVVHIEAPGSYCAAFPQFVKFYFVLFLPFWLPP